MQQLLYNSLRDETMQTIYLIFRNIKEMKEQEMVTDENLAIKNM